MAGWHHWLDGLESEWTPGVGDGQGGLACCDSWGRKELDMTERLNWSVWTELMIHFKLVLVLSVNVLFFNRFLVFPAFRWKKIILSPLNYLTFLSKNNWPYIHISGFYIPFNCSIYLSHAKMTVYLLQLYGSLEIRLYKSFSFVLCQDCFSYYRSFIIIYKY